MIDNSTQEIQRFQLLKQKHKDREIKAAKAKSQAETYRSEVGKLLASEGVTTAEELKSKCLTKMQELSALSTLMETEIQAADAVFAKLEGQV